VPLRSLIHYQVVVTYRVIDPGGTDTVKNMQAPFEIGLRPLTGYLPMGDHRCWTAPKGYLGVRFLQVPPSAHDGNVLYIATRIPSAIVVDQVQIAEIAD
jgi:hypothetical protein